MLAQVAAMKGARGVPVAQDKKNAAIGSRRPANAQKQAPRRPNHGLIAAMPTPARRQVSSAPAAMLNLLAPPKPGVPFAIGEAPPSCRMPHGAMVSSALFPARSSFTETRRPPCLDSFMDDGMIKSGPPSNLSTAWHESVACGGAEYELCPYMINTPTGSCFDGLPPTPNPEGRLWSAAAAEARARALAKVIPRPSAAVLRLSEVLSGLELGSVNSPSLQSTQLTGEAIRQAAPITPPQNSRDLHQLGSPELPSRGSALHALGTCKPCAFVFQEGCKNAAECQFCHLCEPGERKRRKKERRALKREGQNIEVGDQRMDLVACWMLRGLQDSETRRLLPL